MSTNRIKDLCSLNENENAQEVQDSSNVVSEVIAANPVEGFSLAVTDGGMTVKTPAGYQFKMPTESLQFYKQLFDDGAEHKGNYNRHLETVETALSAENLNEMVNLYNKVSKSLAPIEIKPHMYSIVYILLKDETMTKDQVIKLFRAFATEKYDLDEASNKIISGAIKNGIYYYKFLLNLFEYLDK